MTTKTRIACGNEPRSAATLNEQLDAIIVKLRQDLAKIVADVDGSGPSRQRLESLTLDLSSATAEAARTTFVLAVERQDVVATAVDMDGVRCRFKGAVDKKWFTPFGVATVKRRSYSSTDGSIKAVPLDSNWGMCGRHLTPATRTPATSTGLAARRPAH